MEKFTVISLFSGCGGLDYGFVRKGFDILASIDSFPEAVESLQKNYEHPALLKDLTKYGPKDLEKVINTKKVNVIIGGVPCQSFSIAGRRDVNDSRNNLFKVFIEYLDHFSPDVFVFENVLGILSKKDKDGNLVITEIKREMERNYHICINKLNSANFGVPQNRRRVIIIGIHKRHELISSEIVENSKEIAVGSILEKTPEESLFLSEKPSLGYEIEGKR